MALIPVRDDFLLRSSIAECERTIKDSILVQFPNSFAARAIKSAVCTRSHPAASTVQYSTVQYSSSTIVQYSTVQYSSSSSTVQQPAIDENFRRVARCACAWLVEQTPATDPELMRVVGGGSWRAGRPAAARSTQPSIQPARAAAPW